MKIKLFVDDFGLIVDSRDNLVKGTWVVVMGRRAIDTEDKELSQLIKKLFTTVAKDPMEPHISSASHAEFEDMIYPYIPVSFEKEPMLAAEYFRAIREVSSAREVSRFYFLTELKSNKTVGVVVVDKDPVRVVPIVLADEKLQNVVDEALSNPYALVEIKILSDIMAHRWGTTKEVTFETFLEGLKHLGYTLDPIFGETIGEIY